jgi:hypothetical protein
MTMIKTPKLTNITDSYTEGFVVGLLSGLPNDSVNSKHASLSTKQNTNNNICFLLASILTDPEADFIKTYHTVSIKKPKSEAILSLFKTKRYPFTLKIKDT